MKSQPQSSTVKAFAFMILSLAVRLLASLNPAMPLNFSSMASTALFSSRIFTSRWIAVLMPLLLLMLSDSIINFVTLGTFSPFYQGFYWQYLAYGLISLIGMALLKQINLSKVLASSLLCSSLFFIITNFGVWAGGSLYPMNFTGLITCYAMGIPFFKMTLVGNLFFSTALYFAFRDKRLTQPHTAATKA